MLAASIFATGEYIDMNKIPSGSGIDFLVWPLMVIGFGLLIYYVVQNAPKDKDGKREKE